jgi:hypothetical protein
VHLADLARLAFHLVGEDVGLDAGGERCSGFKRLLRRGDQVRGVATEHAVAGLGGFQLAALEPGTHRERHLDAVAVEDRERIGAVGGIGHRRAAGDHGRVVAGHVADRQCHNLRRRAGR